MKDLFKGLPNVPGEWAGLILVVFEMMKKPKPHRQTKPSPRRRRKLFSTPSPIPRKKGKQPGIPRDIP